jgi:hypothetical protein
MEEDQKAIYKKTLTISVRDLLVHVKRILKRVPAVERILRQKGKIEHNLDLIHQLSGLIKENKIVVVHPYLGVGLDETIVREKVHDVLKEWIDLYGVIRLRRKTAAAIDSSAKAVLWFLPQALLEVPATHEEYLELIGHQTRKAIRLAEKQGYEIKEFVWNDHLDEIFEINTSKEIRASEPMRGWYTEPVQPRHHTEAELQYRKYYGAFKDGKLWGYIHLWISGDFASYYHIIGHAEHLKYGIMNDLISHTVRECIGISQIRWLYYGRYQEGSSLTTFKKHAGFQKYAMLLDLEEDQELFKHSRHAVKTLWRI